MSYNNCLQQQNFCCPPVFALPPFPTSSPLLTSAASMLWWKGTSLATITVVSPPVDPAALGFAYVGDGSGFPLSVVPLLGTPEAQVGISRVQMIGTGILTPVNGRIRTFGIRYDLFLIAGTVIPAGSFIEYIIYRAPTTVNSGLVTDATATPAVAATLVRGTLPLPTTPLLVALDTRSFTLSRTITLLSDAVAAGERFILIVRFVPGPIVPPGTTSTLTLVGAVSVTGSVFYRPNGVVV